MRHAAALLLLALASPASPAAGGPPSLTLPFVEDDYGKALAEAKAKKLPIFVEAWAPW